MTYLRKTAMLGVLLVPILATAEDARQTTPKLGEWPVVLEKTTNDALSFTREMMTRIHYANQNAIQIGRLAADYADSPEVRRYGRLVAADRQVQDQQLMDYAWKRLGVMLGQPQFVMEAEHRLALERAATVDLLMGMVGPEFDREYMTLVWNDNRSAIEIVDHARSQVNDPDLRIMFDKTLPILEQHVAIARVIGTRATRAGMWR